MCGHSYCTGYNASLSSKSLTRPSCYDTTSRPAPRATSLSCWIWDAQDLFIVICERSKHCNSIRLPFPWWCYRFFLQILGHKRTMQHFWLAEAVIMCEHDKCNSLGFWQLQATIPSYLNRHSCTTLSLCTPRLNLSSKKTSNLISIAPIGLMLCFVDLVIFFAMYCT
jgi:hypothetical protein